MNLIVQPDQARSPTIDALRGTSTASEQHHSHGRQSLGQRQFVSMEQAFMAHGGLVSGEDLIPRLRARCDQPISLLARWIVARKIVSFSWQCRTLVPLFQFHKEDLTLKVSAARVIAELSDVFDEWELAGWFTEANTWLQGETPLHMMDIDFDAVLDAGRADRFIVRGF